jgi:site-specific DNA-methyltransferase (adenine-specific)
MEKVIQGDCLEEMDKLIEQGVVVDAIITDPPYGTTACRWDSVIPFEPMWERLNKLIKPNGAIVLFGSEPFSSALRMSNIKMYKYDWVWEKIRPSNPMLAKNQPLRYNELISVFYKKQCIYNPQMTKGSKNHGSTKGKHFNHITQSESNYDINVSDLKYPKTIQKFSNDLNTIHPTQKPVALIEYLIKTYTKENETVLDFTAGSGTTGLACKNLNRSYILIEKEPKYINNIKERLN